MPVTWIIAFRAAAAITWRSLAANLCIVLSAIAVSLVAGLEIGVQVTGLTSLALEWSDPFGAYVAIAQLGATVWAVKRAVEVSLATAPHLLSLSEALGATWSFAWRHFVGVFGAAALLYLPVQLVSDGALDALETPALALLAIWSFGPSFVWAVRGMLRVEAQRMSNLSS